MGHGPELESEESVVARQVRADGMAFREVPEAELKPGLEGWTTHTFTPQIPATTAAGPEAATSSEHNMEALILTVVVAILLSYVLIIRKVPHREDDGTPRADEPEKYFQAIVGTTSLDSWSGTAQGCTWTQTDGEIEVTAPLPDGARSKDVSCRVLQTSLKLSICGKSVAEVRVAPKGCAPILSIPMRCSRGMCSFSYECAGQTLPPRATR